MEVENILRFLDDQSRIRAFEHCLQKLEAVPGLNLDVLATCIQLRPPLQNRGNSFASDSTLNHQPWPPCHLQLTERLLDLLQDRIAEVPLEPGHYYKLAEVLLSDGPFAHVFFTKRIYPVLEALPHDSSHIDQERSEGANATCGRERMLRRAKAYLALLQGSYLLPCTQNHIISPVSSTLISRFFTYPGLQEAALDTLSSLFSLLKRNEPIIVAHPDIALPPWLEAGANPGTVVLTGPTVDCSIWDQLSLLEADCFKTGASKIFRVWFQWVSHVAKYKADLKCLHENLYWDRLRSGLLYGYADQRKYCIGILHQSLRAAQSDISTPTMRFRVSERVEYLGIYDLFTTLFETIVLDRYSNQVEACLPELTRLLTSNITPAMATTLLSAALNPTVQEGVRKLIGNWYLNFAIKEENNLDGHSTFMLEGFLPWATLGDLFTSTLISTRSTTYCTHGGLLTNVVAKFVSVVPDTSSAWAFEAHAGGVQPCQSGLMRGSFIAGILDYILNARGRLFQFSILYLLEGLIKGLQACTDLSLSQTTPPTNELEKILQVSRLPGLPEIAGNLYTEYCYQLYRLVTRRPDGLELPGYNQLLFRAQLLTKPTDQKTTPTPLNTAFGISSSLQIFLSRLEESKHLSIQGDQYGPSCNELLGLLDRLNPASIEPAVLYAILDAFWEEADRRQFSRAVAIHLPLLLFHPTCIRACISQHSTALRKPQEGNLQVLLTKSIGHLQRLSEGRPYIVTTLAIVLRKAALLYPNILNLLPYDQYVLRFLSHPPSASAEFLFEAAAAEKLQQQHPHRTYKSYYGEREWYAYAAVIDLLQRFPTSQIDVARNILKSLLEPWKNQRAGVPIISKWKNVLQLQAMLLLSDFCISEADVDFYVDAFRHALILEAWPRYRYLLEWIIARVYYRFPGRSADVLHDLTKLDENSSTHIASLMKVAVLVAPLETESFSVTFMTQLVPFSASPKVQIRHESNFAIPSIFDLALSRSWKQITENPAFVSLDSFIRRLDKFQTAPWTIRTLKLDAVNDFTLVNIFQGQYLTIESPEKVRVIYEDFFALRNIDNQLGQALAPERVPLGNPLENQLVPIRLHASDKTNRIAVAAPEASPAFFQTKSGFDIDSLYSGSSVHNNQAQRPTTIILVASLIDNPTNLGGLSRIAESFGLEALYIDDLKKTSHKDFKATSVTSEKHLPIHELKIAKVTDFLLHAKSKEYEIVGIEQTDRSGILGNDAADAGLAVKAIGTLPKKCVLVLGSEKGGITAEVLAVIDRCVEIKTVGVTRSLNVQTAGGIALYEWWREWRGQT